MVCNISLDLIADISNEINAKNEKKGIWQGKFEMPWDFRRKK